jgi:hypothetical protein
MVLGLRVTYLLFLLIFDDFLLSNNFELFGFVSFFYMIYPKGI